MNKTSDYKIYGLWRVTTEGDYEAQAMEDLGIYEGYIDEIAFALADKCLLSLDFRPIIPDNFKLDMTPKQKTVDIRIYDVNAPTWDADSDTRVAIVGDMLRDRPVVVSESRRWDCVRLTTQLETLEDKRNKALSKLSKEERLLLGLDKMKR